MRFRFALAALAVAIGLSSCAIGPGGTVVAQLPSSVATDCSVDVTSQLNGFLASVPANTTVVAPKGACFLVSNSPSNLLTVSGASGVTFEGQGTTLKQTSYVGGNQQQPVVTITGTSGVSISGFNIVGPDSNGGSNAEGDIGVLMTQNTDLTLDGVNVSNVEGDGLDLYMKGGNQPGVNTNVTVDNSTLGPLGYHAIVPEAVNGFVFENSTVANGNVDAEVDFNCQSNPSDCGSLTAPNVGIVNMTIEGDKFPNGLQLLDGASCMPVGNWKVLNNDLGTGGFNLQMNTTYSLSLSEFNACGQYDGLTVTGNTSTGTSIKPCCGAGSPYLLVQGWKNVNISGNTLVLPTGMTGAAIELWASDATIANNTFTNAPGLWDSSPPSPCSTTPPPCWPASNVTATGDVPSG